MIVTEYFIGHIGDMHSDDNGTYYEDKYEVTCPDKETYVGTYTQCLIYVGARHMLKPHNIAKNFANGIYR